MPFDSAQPPVAMHFAQERQISIRQERSAKKYGWLEVSKGFSPEIAIKGHNQNEPD